MRYWCLSTLPANWEVCLRERIFGLDYRYQITWERHLSEGDKAIIYVASPICWIVGTCSVGRKFESQVHIGWTKGRPPDRMPYLYRYRFALDDLLASSPPLKIGFTCGGGPDDSVLIHTRDSLLNNLIFIADKSRTWNQYLQVSIIAITGEDYATVADRISVEARAERR